jgi:sugar-specific transcriptional regulator TrmB
MRLHHQTVAKIQRLYAEDSNVLQISNELDIPYRKVYEVTRLKDRGYGSMAAYQRERKTYVVYDIPIENQVFSEYLQSVLQTKGKNQNWLAKRLGVSRAAASLYIKGKTLPRRHEEEIMALLPTRHTTLDGLIDMLLTRRENAA